MPAVTETLVRPDLTPITQARVEIRLFLNGTDGVAYLASQEIFPKVVLHPDATGLISVTLPANSTLTPAGSEYQAAIFIPGEDVRYETFIVPAGGGPYVLGSILSVTPAAGIPFLSDALPLALAATALAGTDLKTSRDDHVHPLTGIATDAEITAAIAALKTTANTWTLAQSGPFLDTGGAVFHVDAYGAVGNGTTGDDTAACQAALDAAHAAGGGTVTGRPGGIYLVTATLLVYSNTTVDGQGQRVTFKIKSNPGGARDSRVFALAAASTTDVTFRGVTIDGNHPGYSSLSFNGGLIHGHTGARRIRIEGCWLKNAPKWGITTATADGQYTGDLWILDNLLEGIGMLGAGADYSGSTPGTGVGIFLTHVRGAVIRGNIVRNSTDDGIALISQRAHGGLGVSTVDYCRNVLIEGNVCDTTLGFGSNIVATGQDVVVRGNVCIAAAGSGIRVKHSSADADEFLARDMVIEGNIVRNSGTDGIEVSGTRLRVSGNEIRAAGRDGIRVIDSATAAASADPEATPSVMGWLDISDNLIVTTVESGIRMTATALERVRISGNTVTGCTEMGIRADASATAGVLKDCIIEGNACTACTLSGIRWTGKADRLRIANNDSCLNTNKGIEIASATTLVAFELENNTCRNNVSADWSLLSTVVPTFSIGNPTLTSNVGTPAVPAANVTQPNPYGISATVYVAGGTVTALYVNGSLLTNAAPPLAIRLAPGFSWKWDGSVAPSVRWILDP